MHKRYLQAQINISSYKYNLNIMFLIILIFLPSFLYGGNNNNAFFASTLILQTYFIKNIKYIYFSNDKNFLKWNFILIIYLCFQISPYSTHIIDYFSKSYIEVYSLLSEVSYKPIALNPFEASKNIFLFYNILLIFLITPQMITSKKNLNFIFKLIILIGMLHVLFGLFIEIFDIRKILFIYEKKYYFGSLTGFFINRNNFSYFLLLIFVINFYYLGFYKKYFIKNKKNNSKFYQFLTSDLIIYRMTLIFISVGIILTKSRAGNLSFFLVLFLIIFIEFFREKKINFNILIILSVLLLDLLFLSNLLGLEKLMERISATTIDGEASRLSVFKIGLTEFTNFPIFGFGQGGFEILYRLRHDIYSHFYNHVHNDFIQYLGEFGIIGISVLILWLYQIYKIFLKNFYNRIYEINMMIILVVFITLVHGNLDFALHIPANFYFLFFILSLSFTKIKKSISN